MTQLSGEWTIAIAQYSKSINAVAERMVADDLTYEQAQDYMNNNDHHPIYAYVEGCVEIDRPELFMMFSPNYGNEYKKIID